MIILNDFLIIFRPSFWVVPSGVFDRSFSFYICRPIHLFIRPFVDIFSVVWTNQPNERRRVRTYTAHFAQINRNEMRMKIKTNELLAMRIFRSFSEITMWRWVSPVSVENWYSVINKHICRHMIRLFRISVASDPIFFSFLSFCLSIKNRNQFFTFCSHDSMWRMLAAICRQ